MEIPNEIMKMIFKFKVVNPHPVSVLVKNRVEQYNQSIPWDSFLYDDEEPFYKWHCDQFYIEYFRVGGKFTKCLCKQYD